MPAASIAMTPSVLALAYHLHLFCWQAKTQAAAAGVWNVTLGVVQDVRVVLTDGCRVACMSQSYNQQSDRHANYGIALQL